jgi:ankyrin repeat protein
MTTQGATPLYIAAHKRHASIVDALLHCASIKANQPTLEGATPLWIAASRGYQQIVRRLVDYR